MVQACIAGVQSTADERPELARALSRVAGLLWSARDDLERLTEDAAGAPAQGGPAPAARHN